MLVAVTAPTSAFTSDEGAYALEAASIRDGRWSYDYALRDLDPDGDRFPVVLTSRADDGEWYPYVHHPLWPLALAGASEVTGEVVGLHVFAVVGALAAACVAWLLARELDERAPPIAFWLVALSPVLVNGVLVWAHAPSAAVAGAAMLVALRIGRTGATPSRVLALGAAIALGVLLRSEGVFVAGGAALVIVIAARRIRAAAVLPVVIAAATLFFERRWIASIATGYESPDRTAGGGLVETRVRGAWHVLFDGSYFGESIAVLLLIALGVLVVIGVRPRAEEVTFAAATAAVLIALRWALGPNDAVTGLLVAWPVAVLGSLRAMQSGRDRSSTALVVGLGALALAVLATQYGEGGGFEWGGRYLSPVTVPLAAVAAVGLVGLRGRGAVAVGVVAAISGAMAVGVVADRRHDHDRQIAAVERRNPAVVVTDRRALPRLAWRTHDKFAWWLVDKDEIDDAVADLQRAGWDGIVTVSGDGIRNIRS